MKALSLLQPWASLVAVIEKRWETRSWSTPFRGEVAIHASKGYGAGGKSGFHDLCLEEPFKTVLKTNKALHPPGATTLLHVAIGLPLGAVVAVARITRVLRSEEWVHSFERAQIETAPHEKDFGGYEARRYAWELTEVRQLRSPVPCKGALGLWEVPAEVEAAILEQLT
jgi:hypothetical protein